MPASAQPPLFVYGSLVVTEVLEAVLGRVPQHRPARVTGWRAAALRERSYPGLVVAEGVVDGIVLLDLTPAEHELLDGFEGAPYERRAVTLDDGTDAEAYAWIDHSLALPENWDVERFRREHLAAFLAECANWQAQRE